MILENVNCQGFSQKFRAFALFQLSALPVFQLLLITEAL